MPVLQCAVTDSDSRRHTTTLPWHSATTLEAVVDDCIEFFKRVKANAAPGVVPPVATAGLGTQLRKVSEKDRCACREGTRSYSSLQPLEVVPEEETTVVSGGTAPLDL